MICDEAVERSRALLLLVVGLLLLGERKEREWGLEEEWCEREKESAHS